jgi:hypothetical protein
VPVIASIEGPALGAGAQLAVASDLRVASPDSVIGIPAARHGRVVDHWTVRRLASEFTAPVARAMLLAAENSSGEPADPATIDDQLVGAGALSAGVTDAGIADAFADGWFSDSGALLQVAIWATVLVAIWLAGYLISRRFRRYSLGIAVAIVPFALALFFFYENVNRLLPPNL